MNIDKYQTVKTSEAITLPLEVEAKVHRCRNAGLQFMMTEWTQEEIEFARIDLIEDEQPLRFEVVCYDADDKFSISHRECTTEPTPANISAALEEVVNEACAWLDDKQRNAAKYS